MVLGTMLRKLVFLSLFSSFLGGCNNCNGSQATSKDAGPPPSDVTVSEAAPEEKPRKAPTGGVDAVKHLSINVDALIAANPSSPNERDELIKMLLQRAELMGRPSDLVKADELTKSWGENVHFARAMVLAATKRYEAAIAELDRAQSTPKTLTNKLRFEILINHGEYEEARAMQPAPIDSEDPDTIANAGFLAHRMQKKDDTRRFLALALQRAEEVADPLLYAWICFQQGMMYTLAGDDMTAESWFGSAVNQVPQYAHAAVHLAPSQQPNVALAALEAIAKTSDDPEVAHARALVLERLGKKEDAQKLLAEAAKGYDAILAKLPETYSDHAARFYLGAGNQPAKALELARANAKVRPTEDADDLWMAAAAGAKQPAEACTAAHAMKELRYSSDRGRSLANASCPDAGVH